MTRTVRFCLLVLTGWLVACQPSHNKADAALGLLVEDSQADRVAYNLVDDGPARIWRTNAEFHRCSTKSLDEDFSSGRYNVHRYHSQLRGTEHIAIRLLRGAGRWQPALVVVDAAGEVIFDGESPGAHPKVVVLGTLSGRQGSEAGVLLQVEGPLDVNVYVTGWDAYDEGFESSLPQDATYELILRQECSLDSDDWQGLAAGIELDGAAIPRNGLPNDTLRRSLGVNPEPHGDLRDIDGHRFVSGKVSWFGGPEDYGVTSIETGSISYDRLRSLNDPVDPSAEVLVERPEDYYFAAMRFAYDPHGPSWWRNARLLVVNPETGAAVVVRPVDWGPHTSTSRIVDLSPQAMDDLGLVTDDVVLVSFAQPGSPLGVVGTP